MRNKYILGFLGLMCLWLFGVSYSSGPGQVAGLALTTSPGESGSFCAQSGCHGSGAFDQTTSIEVADVMGNLITQYSPGESYDVSVVITAASGTPGGYGFQMVALKDSDNTSTDSWSDDLPNTVHKVRLMNRDYVEHDGPMTGSNRFTIPWTAPDSGTGEVSFYAAGNAVNRNGSSSGDDAAVASLTIQEAVVSSLKDLGDIISLSVYPNPATDFLKINIQEPFNGELSLYSATGLSILSQEIQTGFTVLDLSDYTRGLYILNIRTEEDSKPIVKKIMVQ
jgi:hypothetical protein